LALAGGNQESLAAFFFYLMQYSVSNVNIFFIIILIGYSLIYNKSDSNLLVAVCLLQEKNSPLQLIKQLKGYYHVNPMLSLSFTITILSLIGIPPLVGFFAKQMVLSAALSNGYFFLAGVGVLTSVVGAVYYLRLLKVVYFDKSDLVPENIHNTTLSSSSLTITVSVLTLVILLFMISPTE